MKAHDIMTRDVVTVRPSTPVREVAVLMTERRISGVPVVSDAGRCCNRTALLPRATLPSRVCEISLRVAAE